MKTLATRRFLVLVLGLVLAPSVWSQADVAAVVSTAASYESGASVEPLRQIERWVAAAAADRGLRRELEVELARLLKGEASHEAKRFACQQLAIIGSDAVVPALAALLTHPQMVDVACQALANIPGHEADDALRAALPHLEGMGKLQVVKTLGTRRDTGAVPALTNLARDADPAIAEAAIASLGKVANPAALKALAALRTEADPTRFLFVGEATLIAADRLAAGIVPKEADKLYEEVLASKYPASLRQGALEGLFRLESDQGQQRILRVLRTRDPDLSPVAIARIPSLKDTSASAKFARELPALEPGDQARLIAALAQRGDAAALPAVQSLLNSADIGVRRAAITALGQLGDASTVFPLARALSQAQSADETKAIELALARLKGGDKVDRALMARLRDRLAGPKAPILGALVRRANRVAWPALMLEAGSADAVQARLAFQGLNRLAAPEETPLLLAALSNLRADIRSDAEAMVAQALERVPQQERRSEYVRTALSQATTPAARHSLLRLLPVCGDIESLVALEAALDDPACHDAALRALADWPNDLAWFSLTQQLGQASSEPRRVVVLRGLTRLAGDQNARPGPGLLERYRQLVAAAQSDADRKLILGALSGCHHPDALNLAVEQLERPGVRAEAAQAVKSIAEAIKAQYPQAAQEALRKVQ